MKLKLEAVSKIAGSETWLHPVDLALPPGTVHVVLGPSGAGKTTLLRAMAGLDRPSGGRLWADERDVTGVPVRRRDVAMVYQQFINYPSLTVFENIASPLRVARRPAAEIERRVQEIAAALGLGALLGRRPGELSGGQQQRTAIARALAKDAGLLLLDEPLANLDYKLREQLRLELAALFAGGRTTVVYATAEPQEALQLGGHTAVLLGGRLLQHGPTLEVFTRPASLEVARVFSDPPLNLLDPAWLDGADRGAATVAVRAHRLRLARRRDDDRAITARVDLAELGGSETFLHLSREARPLVLQLPGVDPRPLGSECTVYLSPADLYGFGADGRLLFGPAGGA
jgi:glycerol transport system ATP-binding protein